MMLSTTQEQLLAAFAALPPEAQRQALDLIAFLAPHPRAKGGARWEQWFATPMPNTDSPPRGEYTSLLVDQCRKQGLWGGGLCLFYSGLPNDLEIS